MYPGATQTRIQSLTKDFATVSITDGIEEDKRRATAREKLSTVFNSHHTLLMSDWSIFWVDSLVLNAQTNLTAAQKIVDNTVGSKWFLQHEYLLSLFKEKLAIDDTVQLGKDIAISLLAPVKDAVDILDMFAQIHPVSKVRSWLASRTHSLLSSGCRPSSI